MFTLCGCRQCWRTFGGTWASIWNVEVLSKRRQKCLHPYGMSKCWININRNLMSSRWWLWSLVLLCGLLYDAFDMAGYMASYGRMTDQWWIAKNLEGRGRDLTLVLPMKVIASRNCDAMNSASEKRVVAVFEVGDWDGRGQNCLRYRITGFSDFVHHPDSN
jgi:hypothetical protein